MSPKALPPDQTSLFLLPFDEVPELTLASPTQDYSEQDNSTRKRYYDACDIRRHSDQLLINGNVHDESVHLFRLQIGDCIFLRPPENSTRPGVGKVVTFFYEPSNTTNYARVQWFYRAEDLSKSPTEASGEDEIFETDHFDDVEVDSIAGRCEVLSHAEWLRSKIDDSTAKMGNDRNRLGGSYEVSARGVSDILSRSVIDIDALPEGFGLSHQESTAKGASNDDCKRRSKRRERGDQKRHVDPKSYHINGEVTADQGSDYEEDTEKVENKSSGGFEDINSSEAASEVESSFMDNYESCAIRYYCRRFYDPRMHVFLVSKYEDQYADPLEELAQQQDEIGDDDFVFKDNDSASGSDIPGEFSSGEEGKPKRTRAQKKRKLSKTGRKGMHRRKKSTSVSQFALPSDSGFISRLPCRDLQKGHVRAFLLGFINGTTADTGAAGSRCLYISGVPGTGKTATVREVLRDLLAQRASGEVAHFDVLEVNAMSLPDPTLVYSELYKALTGTSGVAPAQAAQLLEKRFANLPEEKKIRGKKSGKGIIRSRKRDSCIVLILDEMDVLMTRKQKVLYDMLEWPTRKNARMAVIGIANTMDLPERMLPRLGSRLGLNRLSYPPYTSEQIGKILELTLDQSNVKYTPAALKFCAAKVGAVSGDVRRALELCRRASEIALEQPVGKKSKEMKIPVTIDHINLAINAIAGGSRLKSLVQLSLYEKLLLVTVVTLSRSEGSYAMDTTNCVEAVVTRALDLSRNHSEHFQQCGVPSRYELENACRRLAEQRFVLIEKAVVFRKSRVVVNVSADDCSFALCDCELSNEILAH